MDFRQKHRVALSLKKKLLFGLSLFLFFYVLLEVIVSAIAAWRYHTRPFITIYVTEESGKTIQFDPILGYRLTETPSRIMRIDHGQLEYLGTYLGNKQGFPDTDDFTVKKPSKQITRYLVFGDSFTAAQFLQMNWPKYVEKHAPGQMLQLYNLATDGGGLANWWSNLIRFAGREEYEFDGVIFAVWGDDLYRGFTVADHRNTDRHLFGRVPGWNPADFPKTLEQARAVMNPRNAYVLSHHEFEQVLKEKKLHRSPPVKKPWEYVWIACNSYRLLRTMTAPSTVHTLSAGQIALINEMKSFLDQRHIQPIVVRLPSIHEYVKPLDEEFAVYETSSIQDFQKLLLARYLDGKDAYRGLSIEELQKSWFPNDGHWNQKGSDRFAQWIIGQLTGGNQEK